MTRPLAPSEYVIDVNRLPNYQQSPHELCYFFTFISTLSHAVSKKFNCNIQINIWDFIKCMESFLGTGAIFIDIIGKNYTVKFVADAPLAFEKTDNRKIIKTNLSNNLLSDLDKILADKIFSTNEDLVIENVYTVIPEDGFGDIFSSLLPEQIFLDPDNGGIPQKFRKKWTKGTLYISNAQELTRIDLDTLLSYNSNIFHKEIIEAIKDKYSKDQKLNYKASLFFINLFTLTQIPVKITCGKFNGEPETSYNTDPEFVNTNCFKQSDCSLGIGFSGVSRSIMINDLNEAKSLLSNDKTIIWDAPPLMSKLLVFIDNCNRALNSGESLQDYIDSVKNNTANLQARANCENFGKALDLMLSCLESIFAEGPLSGPIDLTDINYLSDNTITELYKFCDDSGSETEVNLGESHVMIIYGYKENSDDTIDLYIKNTWSSKGIISNKFIIRIKNNTILQEEEDWGLGKFGNFTYFQDKDILIEDKPDICNCCEKSSSSSSSSSSFSSSSSSSSSSLSSSSSDEDESSSSYY